MLGFQILKKSSLKNIAKVQRSSLSSIKYDLFNPSPQHAQLRHTVHSFCESEVSTQGLEWDRDEKFNINLFRKLGDLGLLGITVAEEYGGSGKNLLSFFDLTVTKYFRNGCNSCYHCSRRGNEFV
jgi:hypothetical protein